MFVLGSKQKYLSITIPIYLEVSPLLHSPLQCISLFPTHFFSSFLDYETSQLRSVHSCGMEWLIVTLQSCTWHVGETGIARRVLFHPAGPGCVCFIRLPISQLWQDSWAVLSVWGLQGQAPKLELLSSASHLSSYVLQSTPLPSSTKCNVNRENIPCLQSKLTLMPKWHVLEWH
jgi:hypothetical protein